MESYVVAAAFLFMVFTPAFVGARSSREKRILRAAGDDFSDVRRLPAIRSLQPAQPSAILLAYHAANQARMARSTAADAVETTQSVQPTAPAESTRGAEAASEQSPQASASPTEQSPARVPSRQVAAPPTQPQISPFQTAEPYVQTYAVPAGRFTPLELHVVDKPAPVQAAVVETVSLERATEITAPPQRSKHGIALVFSRLFRSSPKAASTPDQSPTDAVAIAYGEPEPLYVRQQQSAGPFQESYASRGYDEARQPQAQYRDPRALRQRFPAPAYGYPAPQYGQYGQFAPQGFAEAPPAYPPQPPYGYEQPQYPAGYQYPPQYPGYPPAYPPMAQGMQPAPGWAPSPYPYVYPYAYPMGYGFAPPAQPYPQYAPQPYGYPARGPQEQDFRQAVYQAAWPAQQQRPEPLKFREETAAYPQTAPRFEHRSPASAIRSSAR